MDELIRQLLVVGTGMWRHRWIGLIAAWLVGIAGVLTVMSMPDKYEASARIYVDTQSVLQPLMSGLAVQPNVDQQVAMLSRTLLSRPNVQKLVRMSDLDLGTRTEAQKEGLVDALLGTLKIQSAGRDNLYTLSFRDTRPETAKRVVQSLVSIFVESGMGDKRKDAESARKFIEDQIRNYEKKLEEGEARLKEFKLKNMGVAEEGKTYFSRMADLTAKLSDARLQLREAENSRDVLKRELSGEEAIPNLLPDASEGSSFISAPEIDSRIDALKRNLDTLLQKYTDKHPDVVGARKIIAQLEEQKQEDLKARQKAGGGKVAPTNANPVQQQLKISLAEAEANVAALRARVSEYESRYAALRSTAKQQPEVEAEFTQLNRDYEIQKKNYETLVSRREAASMSESMESSTGVADFRVIDPPRVSPTPVAPNRLLILPLVLLGSLGLGAAVTFVVTQIRPTVVDTRGLRAVTGLAVLGTVSLLKTDLDIRREKRRVRAFFAAFGALLMSYGAALVMLWLMTARTA